MQQDQWVTVDRYVSELFVPPDPVLDAALRSSAEAGLPAIHVTPVQGKLLSLLACIRGAGRILEIGTLGGYSTIWLARALPPGGRLVTLEIDQMHAEVARANIERAGLSEVVEIRIGHALDSLRKLEAEGCSPFDMVFIDANKEDNPQYFTAALKLSRIGTVIVVDNVVRNGDVADPSLMDPKILGTRRVLERLASDPRVSATTVQTVGSKGHDGFAIAMVTADSP
jgi:predicted O-methyltransferase YrrM